MNITIKMLHATEEIHIPKTEPTTCQPKAKNKFNHFKIQIRERRMFHSDKHDCRLLGDIQTALTQ